MESLALSTAGSVPQSPCPEVGAGRAEREREHESRM